MEYCYWLYFRELVTFNTLLTVWKIVNWKTPYNLSKIMKLDEDNCINIPEGRILLTRESFCWKGTKEWNELSEDLRNNKSLPSFKKTLRKHLIEIRPLVVPE